MDVGFDLVVIWFYSCCISFWVIVF